MKKQEYIEKYGEEAWKIKAEKDRERQKIWRDNHPEDISSMRKKAMKKWRNSHKEYDKEYSKKWYAINKKNKAEYDKQYRSTIIGRAVNIANSYQAIDKKRGFDTSNNISSKWIVENIFSGQKCVYCGDQDWTHLGCDRIDNSKPHTEDNVVCSCGLCNIERGDRYTVEEFKKYRSLHPRECDIPKAPAIQLSETGALKKRVIQSR